MRKMQEIWKQATDATNVEMKIMTESCIELDSIIKSSLRLS